MSPNNKIPAPPPPAPRTPETSTMPRSAAAAQSSFFAVSFSRKTSGESSSTIVGCM